MIKINLKAPIFFKENRVWRCYTGGVLLDRFLNKPNPTDNYFPEDWLASITRANNGEHQQHPDEGLSIIRMADGSDGPYFKDAVPDKIDVLCKFLDSAVRLPIQSHPDKEFARKYYNSEHGKAESWIILDTRRINNQDPYLLMGFKPDVDKQKFITAVKEQDIPTMENMLHKVPVLPGEVYFIPGRFPHAIGPGVLMLEVQEPTDWVVQPERKCAGTTLNDFDMWGPLTPEIGIECFEYKGEPVEKMLERLRMQPKTLLKNDHGILERIIGPETTDCFVVDKLTVKPGGDFVHDCTKHIAIVTAGRGKITANETDYPLSQGDRFFISEQIKSLRYEAEEKLEIYIIEG